jgi:hypothetical protein
MSSITPLSPPPTRQDPINFADRADVTLTELVIMVDELNVVNSEIDAKYTAVINADIIAENLRGQWVAATAYALKDVYTDNGIAYIVVISHTSTSIANDAANGKVKVWQGVLFSDLDAPSGSTLVGDLPSGVGAVATTVSAQLRRLPIYPENRGCVADGVTDDLPSLRKSVDLIVLQGGGQLWFAPGKTYFLNTDSYLGTACLDFTGCKGLVIEGNGATLKTSSGAAVARLIYLANTHGVVIRNLNFQSTYGVLSGTAGPVWVTLTLGSTGTQLVNCTAQFGSSGLQVYGINDATRVSGITALNCKFTSTYYPQNFQGNGDDYFARGIVTRNCGRSYFPWNVKNHDVCMDSQQGGPFTDVLLKVYAYSTGQYSKLENIKLNYTTTGRFLGSGAQSSEEGMIAIDLQQQQAATAIAEVIEVDITINGKCATPATNANVLNIRKYTYLGVEDTTTRNYVIRNMKIGGSIVNAENLTQDGIRLFSAFNSMSWAGENLAQIITRDLSINGSNVTQNHLYINAQANTGLGQNFLVDNVTCAGNLALVNHTLGGISIDNSTFNNFKRLNTETLPYTPVITTTGGGDSSGITPTAYKIQDGKTTTVQGRMVIADATKMGSNAVNFSLPSTAANVNKAVGSWTGVVAGLIRAGSVLAFPNTNQLYFAVEGSGNYLNSTTYAFANGNNIDFSITYVN